MMKQRVKEHLELRQRTGEYIRSALELAYQQGYHDGQLVYFTLTGGEE